MQRIGYQSDAQDQLQDDGRTRHQKRKIQTEEMITVNVNLEPIHVNDLQDGRNDENKAQQDLQGRFTERMRQNESFRLVDVKQVFPPTGLFASHLVFRHFGANHLSPAHDFLRLVVTRRAVLDGVVVLAQIDDFLILNGGAFAISRLLARRQDQNEQRDGHYQTLFHHFKFFNCKNSIFSDIMAKTEKKINKKH